MFLVVRSLHSVDHVLQLNGVVLIIITDFTRLQCTGSIAWINIQPNKGDKKGNVERNCEVV